MVAVKRCSDGQCKLCILCSHLREFRKTQRLHVNIVNQTGVVYIHNIRQQYHFRRRFRHFELSAHLSENSVTERDRLRKRYIHEKNSFERKRVAVSIEE